LTLSAIESGYIVALLRNHTICIHSLSDLENPLQIITLESTFGAFTLSYSAYGISTRDQIRDERMTSTRMLLLSPQLVQPDQVGSSKAQASLELEVPPLDDSVSPGTAELSPNEEPPAGSGLTPPSSPPRFSRQPIAPPRSASLLQLGAPSASKEPFSSTVAETMVVGPNGIQCLEPFPALLKLETLCNEGRMEEAIAVVDEERRKGRRGELDVDKVSSGSDFQMPSDTSRLLTTEPCVCYIFT
jgi:hypothetical protein